MGGVLCTPAGTFCWGQHVPNHIAQVWSAGGSTHLVFHAELFAIWVSLITFRRLLQDTDLVIWEDNEGARHSLTSGSTSDHTAGIMIHQIWSLIADLDLLPWVARVPSKSNPADGPSRLDFSLASTLDWHIIPATLPPLSELQASCQSLALASRARLGQQEAGPRVPDREPSP